MLHHLLQALTDLETAIESQANGIRLAVHDEELVSEEELALQLFQRVWSKIPAKWKLSCQTSVENKTLNTPRDRLRVDLWSREAIIVPQNVLASLRLWDTDPSSFFVIKVENSPSNDPFTRLFRLLHDASGGDSTIKAIRLRFGQIGLSKLRDRLDLCQLQRGIGEKEFLDRIQFNGDSKEFSKVKTWAAIGRKYDSLSTSLGGLGSMICMPQDVSLAKLERIPSVGDSRTEAIECLQHRGINDQTITDIKFCYVVAEKISRVMQEESESFFLQYEPPPQMPSTERKRKHRGAHGRRQKQSPGTISQHSSSQETSVLQNAKEHENINDNDPSCSLGRIDDKWEETLPDQQFDPFENFESATFCGPFDDFFLGAPDSSALSW